MLTGHFSHNASSNGNLESRYDVLYSAERFPINRDGVWIIGYTGSLREVYENFKKYSGKASFRGGAVKVCFSDGFPEITKKRLERLVGKLKQERKERRS